MAGTTAPDGALPSASLACDGALADGELERILLASQMDVTLLCHDDTTIHYVSPSVTQLMGFVPADMCGKSFAEFLHEEDLGALASEWQRFQDEEDEDPVQFRARHKDGSWVWLEARAGRVEDPRLQAHACVTIREVEHHYRLRARISAAETMAQIGSWRWIVKEVEPHWSPSMYRMLGYEPVEGVLDLDWAYNLIHPEERENFRDSFIACLDDPKPFQLTVRMMAKDGEYRSIVHYFYAERDEAGEILAMLGICQDITAQAEAEEALRKSEGAYRMLAEEASDVIFSVRADGKCTFASPACFGTLGFHPDEMTGKPITRFADRAEIGKLRAVHDRALNGHESQRVTFRGRHKTKDTIWLEAGVRALYDDDGALSELVIVARDITDRREYEEELRAARERAEAANVTKSKFLANMSHELRTPLNAVLGFSEIMKEGLFGPLGSSEYEEYTHLIHESGQFLLDLINDILDMSKIEAGKYDLYLEDIDLEHMIKGCLRIIEARAGSRGVTLDCGVKEDLPAIEADERAVKQILLNLLSNAVKFTPAGGTVRVDAERLGNQVRVSITDTGCGIPADAIPRLAKPFEQALSEANQAQRGTGLGLALVKSFVEMHHGQLAIESAVGQGTTVSFTLPIKANAQKKSA